MCLVKLSWVTAQNYSELLPETSFTLYPLWRSLSIQDMFHMHFDGCHREQLYWLISSKLIETSWFIGINQIARKVFSCTNFPMQTTLPKFFLFWSQFSNQDWQSVPPHLATFLMEIKSIISVWALQTMYEVHKMCTRKTHTCKYQNYTWM